jgi:tape measure domain-containing protein
MPDFAVVAKIGSKDTGISSLFKKLARNAGTFEKKTKSSFRGASDAGSRFKAVLGGILASGLITQGFQKLKEGFSKFIIEGSKIEDATAAFTPLMGGIQGATDLVEALNQTAATTPFQFDAISSTAQALLPAMNRDIGKTVESFRMLGDTVGGNAQKLKTVSGVYTRAILKNKVETGDLNILTGAGIPIYQELANSMGVTVAVMADMTAKGKVTGKELEKVFMVMTSEGGTFFRGMELASETLTGKMSTLKDNIGLTFGVLGLTAFPILKKIVDKGIEFSKMVRAWVVANKEMIKQKVEKVFEKIKKIITILKPGFIKLVNGIKTMIDSIKTLAGSVIKSAIGKMISLEDIMQALNVVFTIVGVVVDGFFIGIKALSPILGPLIAILGAVAAAIWIVNVAMSANPIALIIIGVAALVTGIGLLIKNQDAVKAKFLEVWNAIKKFVIDVATKVATFFTKIAIAIFKTWEKIKGVILLISPAFTVITEIISSIAQNWNHVKSAFTEKGFIGGIKAIGKAIFSGILAPVISLLELLSKIPGALGKLAGTGAAKLSALRKSLFADERREEKRRAPNQIDEDSRARAAQLALTGRIDIAGAPPGSTYTPEETPKGGFNIMLLGANP